MPRNFDRNTSRNPWDPGSLPKGIMGKVDQSMPRRVGTLKVGVHPILSEILRVLRKG